MEIQHVPRSPGNRRINIALVAFIGIIAFFLFTEHRAHLMGILPFLLLLLACLFIHLWMHRGHGDHGGGGSKGDQK